MSLEERHWPSLCIIALLLALSVVAVVEVCADARPVINAVLNSAIAIYLDFMVSSIVNRNNTGCAALVPLVGKGCAPCGWMTISRRRMASDQPQEQFGPWTVLSDFCVQPLSFKCGDERSTDTWHLLGQPR